MTQTSQTSQTIETAQTSETTQPTKRRRTTKSPQVAQLPEAPILSIPPKAPTPRRTPKPHKAPKFSIPPNRAVAIWAGCTGCAVLALSVSHVARAIQAITGECTGSVLLAIGVDLGMLASEAACVVCAGCADVERWAKRVVWGTLALSVSLNVWAFCAGKAGWVLWGLSGCLGALTPCLVFGLLRVTAATWQARRDG
jgi:hypothetical protein